jgi:copper chaperone CopZ
MIQVRLFKSLTQGNAFMMMEKLNRWLIYFILIAFLFSFSNVLAGELTRTTMKVSNLFCGACLTQIDSALREFPEVTGMDGSIKSGIVTVDHSPIFKGEVIASKITELGYPAEIRQQSSIDEKNAFSFGQKSFGRKGCCGSTGSPDFKKYGGCGATAASWKKLFWHILK